MVSVWSVVHASGRRVVRAAASKGDRLEPRACRWAAAAEMAR